MNIVSLTISVKNFSLSTGKMLLGVQAAKLMLPDKAPGNTHHPSLLVFLSVISTVLIVA